MYYEEAVIDGVLCWRGSPDAAWTKLSDKELTYRIVKLKVELAKK